MMANLRAQDADRQPILKIFSKEAESKITESNLL
jgi:hypothetical protein